MNTWEETRRARNLADHGIDFAELDDFFLGELLTREDSRQAYGDLRLQNIGLFKVLPCSSCGHLAAKTAIVPT